MVSYFFEAIAIDSLGVKSPKEFNPATSTGSIRFKSYSIQATSTGSIGDMIHLIMANSIGVENHSKLVQI